MTSPHPPAYDAPPPGCPAHRPDTAGLPGLYGPGFAADPYSTYQFLQQQGPASWVELAPATPAIVVTDYACALDVLRSPYFSKDARRWKALNQGQIPPHNELLPMMAWRPSMLFADGERHLRLRQAADDSLERVDAHRLRSFVRRSATQLIQYFGPRGRADLVSDYADRLPILVFAQLFGCSDEAARGMAAACAQMIDAEPSTAQIGGARLAELLGELIMQKRERPGEDLTSWLIQHPVQLTDEELVHQHVVLIGAGTVPMSAWISTTTMVMLTDDRFAGDLSGGSLTIGDALNEVLWTRSPMSNFCFHYATTDYEVRDRYGRTFTIPTGVPVLISLEAANGQISDARTGHRASNHSHLAFSAGPHVCPAQNISGVIADIAVETLLDQLPDMQLAVAPESLTWRPGPFHRTLTALPVHFPAVPASPTPATSGGQTWTQRPVPHAPTSTPPAATSTQKPPTSAHRAPRRGWNFREAFRRGR